MTAVTTEEEDLDIIDIDSRNLVVSHNDPFWKTIISSYSTGVSFVIRPQQKLS